MKKLHLDLAALRVESFVAAPREHGFGTVHAHESGYPDRDTDTFADTDGSCFTNLVFPTDLCTNNPLTVQVSCYEGTCNQNN